MSEESFHSEHPGGWVEWFCSIEDHIFLCEIDPSFILDPNNSIDVKEHYSCFNEAIEMILQNEAPDSSELQNPRFLEVYQQATELYGHLHLQYISTPIGLAIMRERYLQGRFGDCPRVYCDKQNVLPIGLCEEIKTARVKVYCPRCQEAYTPKLKQHDLDGSFFGKSFPQLLLFTYPDLHPNKYNVRDIEYKKFIPTLYGFKVQSNKTIENSTNLQKELKEIKQNYNGQNDKTEDVVQDKKKRNKTKN